MYRRSLDVELFPETLDALEDQYDFAADIAACRRLDKIVGAGLIFLELHRVKEILPCMLRNAEGPELTSVFGQKRNTITKQFYRGMRKAAQRGRHQVVLKTCRRTCNPSAISAIMSWTDAA